MNSIDDIFIKKISEEKQIDIFYAKIIRNIYDEIEKAIEKSNRAIFFSLPVMRFGESLENPNAMGTEIKRILKIDNIQSFLIKKNNPLMYIFWENKIKNIKENESKYGALNLNAFIEKHRN